MVEDNLNWVQEAISWKALPKDIREPKTVRNFCKLRELPESTFYYEISKSENQVKILRKSLDIAKESTPEVLDKLVENARSGKERSIEIFLKYLLGLDVRHVNFESRHTEDRAEENRQTLREIVNVLSNNESKYSEQ